jgi:hypothetical protein
MFHLFTIIWFLLVLYGLFDFYTQGNVDRDFIFLPLQIHLLLLGADVCAISHIEHNVDLTDKPSLGVTLEVHRKFADAIKILKRRLKLVLLVRHVQFVLAGERLGQQVPTFH